MVGVPGKSRGCNTCRRRKKGCDQRRPACSQCLKAGIPCSGYTRETRFINYSFEASAPSAAQPSTSTALVSSGSIVPLPQNLERNSRRIHWYGDFVTFLLRQGSFGLWGTGDWVRIIPDLANRPDATRSSALTNAFDALATARMTLVSGEAMDTRIEEFSKVAYGNALRQLHSTLSDQGKAGQREALAAVMMLQLYEVYAGSTNRASAWRSHVRAAATLANLRRDHVADSVEDQQLYLACRLYAIIEAIGRRDPSQLTEPDWSIEPWSLLPKSSTQRVLDTLSALPAILKRADQIQLNGVNNLTALSEKLSAVAQESAVLEAQLIAKEQFLADSISEPLYWRQPLTPEQQEAQGVSSFNESFKFPNFELAYGQLLIWTGLLTLYLTQCATWLWLQRTLPKPALGTLLSSGLDGAGRGNFSFPPSPDVFVATHMCAMNIGKSLEYFLGPDVAGVGAGLIGFPIGMTRGYFEFTKGRDSPEVKWIGIMLKRFREHSAVPLDKLLDSMAEDRARRFKLAAQL